MQVSKSGYYYWKHTPQSPRSRQNDKIVLQIIQAFKNSRQTYGSPRIYHELKAQGVKVSLNKVARLMNKNDIYAHFSIRHKKAKIPRNNINFANNILNREFIATTPNSKWVSDTTFVWTQQGWLYLATVIDLYSRKVAGWSMGKNNDTALVIDALSMAIKNKPRQQQVLLHSDQGSTYRAYEYLALPAGCCDCFFLFYKNFKIGNALDRVATNAKKNATNINLIIGTLLAFNIALLF